MKVLINLAALLFTALTEAQSSPSSASSSSLASAVASGATSAPTNPSTCPSQVTPQRIHTHSHFVPPFYRSAALAAGFSKPDGFPGLPAWSEDAHLAWMASGNVSKSIISISSPGTYLIPGNNTAARALSRQVNEFAADLKWRRPNQFGFWASLPLPDVEGSLTELAYAFDCLDADGVVVYTNAHGTYLGDSSLDAVFAELNRRNAAVFVHPTSPYIGNASLGGWQNIQSSLPQPAYAAPMMEFLFDTARAVFNMFLTGFFSRFSDVTFILSHAGGAIPTLVDRVAVIGSLVLGISPDILNADVMRATFARQFYFDLAGTPFPDQIYGLLRYVDPSRLTYGSDYPFTPASLALSLERKMDTAMPQIFPFNVTRAEIYRGNAEGLLDKNLELYAANC